MVTCTGSSREDLGSLGGDPPLRSGLSGLAVASPISRFAHPSEERFARLLDFYRLRWEYEPHTFAVSWSTQGEIIESFTPDFWLPDLGLYVELTTLRQSLVTRKNRKLRRFRELHPDKRVRLLYRGDIERLMAKYAGGVPRAAGRFHLLRA